MEQGKPGGYCTILRCWLTERQCQVRRTRAASGSSPSYISCIDCAGKSFTTDEKIEPGALPKMVTPTSSESSVPLPENEVKGNMVVLVDFTEYPDLYEWLKQKAKDNFRPIEYQILAGLTDLKG